MLIHGRASLTRLATTLEQIEHPEVETRRLSSAVLREEDIDTLARVYKDVLLADLDPQEDEELFDFLATEGFDLASALTEGGRDEITRSDATELLAAAALIGSDSWDPDYMFMPNVPKMSRAKSDSGWDVLEVRLQPGKGALSPLTSDEWLRVASVKHSVLAESDSMMSKLKASFRTELSAAYVATQLRVIHHRLRESGRSKTDSDRIYLLASAHVSGGKNIRLSAVGVVDETTLGDALTRGRSALNDQENWERLAVLGVARLAELHVRCN